MSADIVFPIMPFADVGRPSMGIGLISAHAQNAGFSTKVLYFNLSLAEEIGVSLYGHVANGFKPDLLVGEWFFADLVFGEEIPPAEKYLNDFFGTPANGDDFMSRLMAARNVRDRFVDRCVHEIMNEEPRFVGFTSTFHQTCACLLVAKRLKELPNPPVVLFGGANCEGEMGLQLIRSFPWIDYICCGEADNSFPQLLNQLNKGQEYVSIPGVLKQGISQVVEPSQGVKDMDALPYPDFDGYFDSLNHSTLKDEVEGHLVFETSRGCWWGAKHHCTFCGLNGQTMSFRSKKPDRALEEIEYLTKRHQTERLGCVDNILDMRYVDTLFPEMAARGLELDIFYEVKSNLRYAQLKKMREGGLQQIQPGIESFSNQVLDLMDKGCSGLQNVQLLRWCRELGIEVSWNVLSGFPGELPEEYKEMARLIPQIIHLDPPGSNGLVRLDRFSPFHTKASESGFSRVRPARAYFYVFPLGRRELNNLAYYFDFDYEDGRDPNEYLSGVNHEIQIWSLQHSNPNQEPPKMEARCSDGKILIEDTRSVAVSVHHELSGLEAEIYLRCDKATTAKKLASTFNVSQEEVKNVLRGLEERNLVFKSDSQYLSLAVFVTRPAEESAEVNLVSIN